MSLLEQAVDLTDFPLHCPKCGMEFRRKPWAYKGDRIERSACDVCGVDIHSAVQGHQPQAVHLQVESVDQARRCWGPRMKPFTVSWSLTVDALTPREAAERAWKFMRTWHAEPPTLSVRHDDHVTDIDLSQVER